MSNEQQFRLQEYTLADRASQDERASFIVKTYVHLLGAVLAYIMICATLLQTPAAEAMTGMMMGSRWGWLIVLAAFMGISYVANRWAQSSTSMGMQYAGLSLYVIFFAMMSVPLLFIAQMMERDLTGPGIIAPAGITTVAAFTGLTLIVFFTRKNFSFLRSALTMMGFIALGLIVVSIIFQFDMGLLFIVPMIGFCCLYILYDTSNVLHEYHIGQHVAASLALFSSLGLLFWYILQLFMRLRD
jgi:hypothetical protein